MESSVYQKILVRTVVLAEKSLPKEWFDYFRYERPSNGKSAVENTAIFNSRFGDIIHCNLLHQAIVSPKGCAVKMKQKRTEPRIELFKLIWCKIRYWQSLRDVPDADLASDLGVGERTLKDYDQCAKNITLEKLDNFLYLNGMELHDLLEK